MTKGTLKHRFTSAVVLCACTMLAACSGDSAPTTHSQGGSQGSSNSSIETNAAENPDILLIMVDDLGFNDLAINNLSGSGDTPNLDAFAQKGIRFTRQGRRTYQDAIQETYDPWGRKHYWIGGGTPVLDEGADTDVQAVVAGWVSVTPLHLDRTNYDALAYLAKGWGEGLWDRERGE